ncbi:hypothetical protein [Aquimarina rhabdastrellae]
MNLLKRIKAIRLWYKELSRLKRIILLVIELFIYGILIGLIAGEFKNVYDYRWIYEYGTYLALLLFGLSVLGSVIISMVFVIKSESDWKKDFIWLCVSIFPVIYVAILMIIGKVIPVLF